MSDNSTQNGAAAGAAAAGAGHQTQPGTQARPGQADPNSKLPQFALIRIYAKDCSLETPRSPEAFQEP